MGPHGSTEVPWNSNWPKNPTVRMPASGAFVHPPSFFPTSELSETSEGCQPVPCWSAGASLHGRVWKSLGYQWLQLDSALEVNTDWKLVLPLQLDRPTGLVQTEPTLPFPRPSCNPACGWSLLDLERSMYSTHCLQPSQN